MGIDGTGGQLLVALVVVLIAAVPVLLLLRSRQILDTPGERSFHTDAVPRAGGIALLIGLCAGLAVGPVGGPEVGALALTSVLLGVLGLADDVRSISVRVRLSAQLLVSLAALPLLLDGLSGGIVWKIVFAAGVWLWLAAYVNAFNFMDGIDGISVAQAVVAGAVWWAIGEGEEIELLAAAAAVATGAALGFAPFSVPRARMFLGDVGSYALGAWLAVTVVVGLRAGIAPVAMLAPIALYLGDTGTTLLRRVLRGDPWYESHREHTYQRLVIAGWSHLATTAFVATLIATCSAIGVVGLGASTLAQVGLGVLIALVVGGYLAAPAFVRRRAAHAEG